MTSASPTFDGTSLTIVVALFAVWVLVRTAMWMLSVSRWKWLLAPVSLLAAWGFWRSALISMDSLVETASTWPRGGLALMAAGSCDVALTLYVDHRSVKAGVVHWMPIGLRLLLVALLTLILMEPIVSYQDEKSAQRQVAVLLDASASMDLGNSSTAVDKTGDKASRRDVARQLLLEELSGNPSLLDQLELKYSTRLFEFADTPREVKIAEWRREQESQKLKLPVRSGAPPVAWAQATETASAIHRVNDLLPLDELSGLVVVTDGCDHSSSDWQESVRALVQRGIPVHTVLVGDRTPIRDAEVASLQAPRQVFVGDSVAIRAPIKADLMAGQSVKVRLVTDAETIEEKTIQVRGDRHRETIVFRVQADTIGVHEYSVELGPIPGERIKENNQASVRLWVSKDHIRMLLVENRPRWEFRYLKNLFAGRDRSVQLQYVLLHPDRLAGVPDPPLMHASVNRTFDDCEATALPENEEEWLKFDVIVIGDVPPEDLGTSVLETLEKFVANRGGSLIILSGRQHMPHSFAQTPLADVLPVQLTQARKGDAVSPDASYYFKVATGAESHVIMQQSTDPTENNPVWQSLPQLHWRHPVSKAKTGATVLAYAGLARDAVGSRQDQQDRALVLWHRYGAGKVMQLTFDQTWRLRYGVGDRHHHQFWGQVLRWSIQDRLAAGTELVRLGTDRVLYRVDDTVKVRARLLDENRNSVKSDDTQALVYLDDELIQRTILTSEPSESGMLTAAIDGLVRAGKYRIELAGPTVERLLRTEGRTGEVVSVDFALEGSDLFTEMSDLVADANSAVKLADWTGGVVVGPEEAASVVDRLGPKSTFHREQWTIPLWNLWPVIVSFLLIVGVEWGLRKSTGLI